MVLLKTKTRGCCTDSWAHIIIPLRTFREILKQEMWRARGVCLAGMWPFSVSRSGLVHSPRRIRVQDILVIQQIVIFRFLLQSTISSLQSAKLRVSYRKAVQCFATSLSWVWLPVLSWPSTAPHLKVIGQWQKNKDSFNRAVCSCPCFLVLSLSSWKRISWRHEKGRISALWEL